MRPPAGARRVRRTRRVAQRVRPTPGRACGTNAIVVALLIVAVTIPDASESCNQYAQVLRTMHMELQSSGPAVRLACRVVAWGKTRDERCPCLPPGDYPAGQTNRRPR